ncbi:hypothetical protein GRF29_1g1479958 [Pseudopithomyces chartarum]|uniref:DNA polymerase n=1 Tax=Pseudopithomyces chartarum TaxID=1892770 RepID=A0AAN6M9L7_9PLEO|nr:hypothetical protein GRF29_1g1479958 [Pseudopithomyces chartarum]
MDTFRFRLNCIDHYQAIPTELDPVLRRRPGQLQRHNAPLVPVIRVFGATETGQKVCAHIHGALPYLYIDYNGSLEQDKVKTYVRGLRASIDHALAATYRRNAYDTKTAYVGHITLVKGIPFYGYHVRYRFFLKVYLLNPAHMTRFADLLHQGAILNRIFQPYESHLQYLLQWMCDYNLYGCDYIDCAKVNFRGPVPNSGEIDAAAHKWHDASIPDHLVAEEDQYPRQSHCSIEVDVCVQDILNRHEIHPRPIHDKLFEQSDTLKSYEKYVPSMAGLWKDETIRRKKRLGLSDPSSSPFPPEVLVSMSADMRSTAKGGWVHEEDYRERLIQLVESESQHAPVTDQATFLKPVEGGVSIQTAVESVEDLYPGRIDTEMVFEDEDWLQPPVNHDLGPTGADGDMQMTNGPPSDADTHDGMDMEDPGPADQHSLDPLSLSEAQIQQQVEQESGLASENTRGSGAEDEDDPRITDDIHDSLEASSPSENDRWREETLFLPDDTNKAQVLDRTLQGEASQTGDKGLQPAHRQFSQRRIKTQDISMPTMSAVALKESLDRPTPIPPLSQPGHLNPQFTAQPLTIPSKMPGRDSISTIRPPSTHLQTSLQADVTKSSKDHLSKSSIVNQLAKSTTKRSRTLHYALLPPPAHAVKDALSRGLLPIRYKDAYYSDELDVPDRPREYAGRQYVLRSTTIPYLPAFNPGGVSCSDNEDSGLAVPETEHTRAQTRPLECNLRHWELCSAPPSYRQVERWLLREAKSALAKSSKKDAASQRRKKNSMNVSQVEGPTQKNKHGFKYSQKKASTSVKHETQYMSILSLEVHVNSRGSLVPDPAEDEVQSIFWCFQGDGVANNGTSSMGIICLSNEEGVVNRMEKQTPVTVEAEEEELDLINKIVDIVRYFDPDILTGYEVHNSSWGYLIERARLKYEYDLCDEISRTKSQSHGRFGKEADRWGFNHTSTIRVTGRHMINIWRAMRGELNLLQYTMENVVFHLLHKRTPHYQHADITAWYKSGKPRDLSKVLDYFITRVQLNLEILEANEIVPRTSEQARLLGVDFFSVISRGSQYKVESTMFRIAKPENYILVSPSRKQVGKQNALECLPLVMEPHSAFYPGPVLVLDFQSLYPSVMIAYNYCYSTCLGRVVPWRGRNKLGFTDFDRESGLLGFAKEHINIAPNGMMYVKPEMRKSLLAKLLGEILETRVMVRSGMKQDKEDKTLQQLLNNRQLALKLLANVTYGYTSASFSGRMPCSEIADSIVQTGRETLEKAIALIHSNEKWGAEVVYGDTDSLFIHLEGRTREQAFSIGEEIAETITQANPRPIKLKFEKVYHPCVLLAKKRYVGFKYESRDQKEPEFDAKGIETVRRDGTPAEQKIEEKALKILFQTSDLSQVKEYFLNQCTKIMEGRVSIQDFLFAKEVKLGTYSERGPPPPGALIATKRMLADPRAEPQYGERIPYVVITGAPNARLVDRCVSPETLLQNDSIELDAEYYITKNLIPPLERIFNLVGANVRQWYEEMPKVQRVRNMTLPVNQQQYLGGELSREGDSNSVGTLGGYMKSSTCLLCRSKLSPPPSKSPELDMSLKIPLCRSCIKKPSRALLGLKDVVWKNDRRTQQVEMICRSCSNLTWGDEIRCDSRDCPVFYTRVRQISKVESLKAGLLVVADMLEEDNPDHKSVDGGDGDVEEEEKEEEGEEDEHHDDYSEDLEVADDYELGSGDEAWISDRDGREVAKEFDTGQLESGQGMGW